VWPPGSLRGFDLGRGPAARHFRTYLVRNGSTRSATSWKSSPPDDDSPIVLAVQHTYLHQAAEARSGAAHRHPQGAQRRSGRKSVVAGSG
jgi:hypothetical protein